MQGGALKRLLVGRPRQSSELKHQLLPKWMALPVFSSDPLSSTAYATQEMMLVLTLAGTAAYANILPLSFAVAALLAIVVVSYRQTVRAYPQGGGAYRVSRENLGDRAGLTAASALLIDYTLTVAVSIAAGVAAITSAVPAVGSYRVVIALAFVGLVTLANLRGVKEAGLLFAVPTYTFVVIVFLMIGTGLVQCLGGCPQAPSAGTAVEVTEGVGLFLLLRAFSSGATALTGVEAISDGVPAFRYPQSRNAAQTLGIMGVIAISMFLGTSFLARATGIVHTEESSLTVMAEIAQTLFGNGIGFYLVQIVTALILILAANTAYADFPRLASILAVDRFLPRQFVSRGDRLVFSNGVLLLAAGASLLLVIFGAQVTRLIQLYVVGVFTSFTLSQLGMVMRHRTLREPGWQRGALINGAGGITTAVVLIVVAITKFVGGAWLVIVGIPLVAFLMARIHAHYQRVSVQLRAGVLEDEAHRSQHVVIVFDRLDEVAARALAYARTCGASSIVAFALPAEDGVVEAWRAFAPDVAITRIASSHERGAVAALRDALVEQAGRHPGGFTTALIAETASDSWIDQLRDHRLALRIKRALLSEPDLVVTDFTAALTGIEPSRVTEPVEHHVVVLVSAVHKASLRAIAFAEGLHPTSLRALSINLDTERSNKMLEEWEDWGVDIPLEVIDSPFREMTETLDRYLAEFRPDGTRVVVTCVLPEFVLPHVYQQPLHNQTALMIKARLLFERGVVTTSVPFHIPDRNIEELPAPAVRGRA